MAQELRNAPGFFPFYQAGHGYSGRHYFNPETGEALSQRQGADIYNGRATLEGVLSERQVPLKTEMSHTKAGTLWKKTTFRTMSGARAYAVKSRNPSYFIVHGHVRRRYEGEQSYSYRALTTTKGPTAVDRDYSLNDLWSRTAQSITVDSATTYVVWERVI